MLSDYFYVQLRQSVKVVLPLDKTTEVISVNRGQICPIPGVTPALLGVVNQRGKLLWVLDLSDLLKLPPSPKELRSQDSLTLVVLSDNLSSSNTEQAEHQVGCVVSQMKGIIPLNPENFEPVSTELSSEAKSTLLGMTTIEHSKVAAINVDEILATLRT